jgi:hypothetical protein
VEVSADGCERVEGYERKGCDSERRRQCRALGQGAGRGHKAKCRGKEVGERADGRDVRESGRRAVRGWRAVRRRRAVRDGEDKGLREGGGL